MKLGYIKRRAPHIWLSEESAGTKAFHNLIGRGGSLASKPAMISGKKDSYYYILYFII